MTIIGNYSEQYKIKPALNSYQSSKSDSKFFYFIARRASRRVSAIRWLPNFYYKLLYTRR